MRACRTRVTAQILFAAAGIAFSSAAVAEGLDPAREIVQYSHRAWTKRDGLPQNSVEAIAQTPDGYMWFGTVEGLARFDGESFRNYNVRNTPHLEFNYISSLCVTRDSSMYIGNYGGMILRWRDGVIRPIRNQKGVEHYPIETFLEDREGGVWVAGGNGLMYIQGDSVVKVYGVADGLPHPVVYALCEARDGTMYVATPAGIWVRNQECFEPWMKGPEVKTAAGYGFTFATPHVLNTIPTALLADRDGGLWIGTKDHGLFRYHGGELTSFAKTPGLDHSSILQLYQDRRGSVWIGTAMRGLVRYADGRFSSFSSEDGLSGNEVLSLFEDREGNLWVGVSTAGVNRFTNSKFTTFRIGSNVIENMIWSVGEGPRGEVLVSSAVGRLFASTGKRFDLSKTYAAYSGGVAATYVLDRNGTFWIGGTKGVLRFEGSTSKGFPVGTIHGAAEDRYGRVWFAGATGLFVYERGRMTRLNMSEVKAGYRSVLFDRKGDIWLASRVLGVGKAPLPPPGSGPPQLDTSSFHWYPLVPRGSTAWVMNMSMDSLGGIWVATMGAGLKCIRGDSVRTVSSGEGLPEEVVYIALPDDAGSLWFSSNNGVHRARTEELYELFDGLRETVEFESYGISDGMYSDECNGGYQASALKGRDGRLWFPTTSGVVMVDPHRMPSNTVPPAVVIERIGVDNVEGPALSGISYPPGNGDLEFHFIGLSFTAPERVRYRYLLEGFNKQWIDAGDRREAFYTNIRPGTYRFRVQAANSSGVWNDTGAAVAFTLRPHFHQTVWFALLIGLLVIGGFVLGHVTYKRYRDREVRSSRLESELARAQVQILEMQLQPHFLFNTLNSIMVLIRQEPEMASRMVARLSEFLRLTLDSAGMQEVTLRRELEFLDRYLHIERIRFGDRLHIEQKVDPALLDAMVPNLILQPLVENAIRHGVSKRRGPALITVSAGRSNGDLTIHIKDNGAGLSSRNGGQVNEGIGLKNTRQRLHHLYGEASTFLLESPPDGGVDVVMTFPFHSQDV